MDELRIKGMTRQEYDKKRYRDNRDNILSRVKEYYHIHRNELLERHAQYRHDNHDKVLGASRKCNKLLNIKEKLIALTHYGNNKAVCVRCGFSDIRALSIDHINGGGKSHIKSINKGKLGGHFYHWLKVNDYPDGFQTLCMNCQWIKRSENNEG